MISAGAVCCRAANVTRPDLRIEMETMSNRFHSLNALLDGRLNLIRVPSRMILNPHVPLAGLRIETNCYL